jgi:hypothetical protein
MSRETRRRLEGSAGPLWIRFAAVVVVAAFTSGTAMAQATAPAPQQPPPLEAGDTAPPPGAPPAAPPPGIVTPIEPLAPTAAPIAPGTPAVQAPLLVPAPAPPRKIPIYRSQWFWGAVSVIVVTGIVVLALSLSNSGAATPNTRLGDMRAF